MFGYFYIFIRTSTKVFYFGDLNCLIKELGEEKREIEDLNELIETSNKQILSCFI